MDRHPDTATAHSFPESEETPDAVEQFSAMEEKTAPYPAQETDEQEQAEAEIVVDEEETSAAPTILVVHASVGSGHRSAAVGIAQAFEEMRDSGRPPFPDGKPLPKNTVVEVIDILDFGRIRFDGDKYASSFTGATRPIYDVNWRYSFTGRLLWGGGTGISDVMFPRFTKHVKKVKPLAVVCTHIIAANCAVGARLVARQTYPVIAVPTDYETEGLWPHRYCDAFCVGTEYMAETLRARRIPEDRIFITGIPTRSDFRTTFDREKARSDFGLPEDKSVVLALAGARLPMPYVRFRDELDQALPYLHRFPNMHLVIVAGKDKEYAQSARARCTDLGLSNVTVLDYCNEMSKLMAASNLVICKAGGLTVTECLCSSTPMILMGKAYGQEKANVNMLTGNGAAIHVTTARELKEALEHFSQNPHLIDSMLLNANLLRRPNAAPDIVEIALRLAAADPETLEMRRRVRKHPHWLFMTFAIGRKPAHVR